jgi:rfaE bifunctional protein kinase chain/domain
MAKSKSILLLGDFITNEYFLGNTSKLDGEVPIPIVDVFEEKTFLMGAALIAESMKNLDLNVKPIGLLGDDKNGKWIKKVFNDLKIPTSSLITSSDFLTGTETRIFANSCLVSRYDKFQKSKKINKNILTKLYNLIKKEIKKADVVIVFDYGHTPLTDNINELLKNYSKKIPVLISTTGKNYLNFKNSNVLIKINRNNANYLVNNSSNSIKPKKVIKEISKILNLKEILLTLADDGAIILNQDEIFEIPATKHVRIDPKGIGEIMLSAMCMSLIDSDEFDESCKIGNIAAGLAISKGFLSGEKIYTIKKKELKIAIKEYENWLLEK